MTATADRVRWWPWAMLAAGPTLLLGGVLHPQEDDALTEPARTGAWLADPAWVPAHLLLLLAALLLVVALLGLLTTRPDLPVPVRRAARVALAGAALWVVEGVPHVLAAGDAHAATAGHAMPFFSAFQQLAPLVYPVVGVATAGLAVLGGRRLAPLPFAAAGAVGGVAYALAPLVEGLGGVDELDFLYALGLLMAVWWVGVGLHELVRRQDGHGRGRRDGRARAG